MANQSNLRLPPWLCLRTSEPLEASLMHAGGEDKRKAGWKSFDVFEAAAAAAVKVTSAAFAFPSGKEAHPEPSTSRVLGCSENPVFPV